MDYKRVVYTGDIAALDNDDFRERLEATYVQVDAQNHLLYQEAIKKYNQLLTIAIEIYGARHVVVKYLNSRTPEKPVKETKAYQKLLRKYDQWRAAETRRQKQREYVRRRNQAIETLEALGYEQYEHFEPGRAITFAKQVLVEVSPGVYSNRMLPAPGETSAE